MGKSIRSWTTALIQSVGVRERSCHIKTNQKGSSGRKNASPMLPSGGNEHRSCTEERIQLCGCGNPNFGITEKGKPVKRLGGKWIGVG